MRCADFPLSFHGPLRCRVGSIFIDGVSVERRDQIGLRGHVFELRTHHIGLKRFYDRNDLLSLLTGQTYFVAVADDEFGNCPGLIPSNTRT